jgi:hypothetical protein
MGDFSSQANRGRIIIDDSYKVSEEKPTRDPAFSFVGLQKPIKILMAMV